MLREQVSEFMDATGQTRRTRPTAPPDNEVILRNRLVMEEAFELLDASTGHRSCVVRGLKAAVMQALRDIEVEVDMVEIADALADIDYVVEGTRLCFGIYGESIADEVHRSNMAKVQGGYLDDHGKFQKPDNWSPPDILGCLKAQGYHGQVSPHHSGFVADSHDEGSERSRGDC
jgi:predicted HAD superfamily Cof-like phosphohydrolase